MGGESSTGGGGAASAVDGSDGNSSCICVADPSTPTTVNTSSPSTATNNESSAGNPLNQSNDSGKALNTGQLNIRNNTESTQAKTQSERGESKTPDSQPQRNIEMDAAELNVIRQPDRSTNDKPGSTNNENPGDKRSNTVEMPETTIRATPSKRAESEQPINSNNTKSNSSYTPFDQSLPGIPNNTKSYNNSIKTQEGRAKDTIEDNDSLIIYPHGTPNLKRSDLAPPSISDEAITPIVRIPFNSSPQTHIINKNGKEKGKTNKIKQEVSVPSATQIEPKRDPVPQSLTPELAKKIVDAVVNDTNFEKDNIKGNYFERIFTWFGGSYSGSIREGSFVLLDSILRLPDVPQSILSRPWITIPHVYDAHDPEVDKLVCTGISNAAIEAIKKNPEVVKQLTKLDTTTDRGAYTGVAHTAVLVVIGKNEYVFDWYQSLEADNPRIHTYQNWLNGDDDKGVYYEDIKNDTFAGQ